MPPEPAMFWTMICWPRSSDMRAAMMRPATSIGLPAAKETTIVMGRLGQSCAAAGALAKAAAISNAAEATWTRPWLAMVVPCTASSPLLEVFNGIPAAPGVVDQPVSFAIDIRRLDRSAPALDLAGDELAEIIGRSPLGRDQLRADFFQPLLHARRVHRRDDGGVQLLHDGRRGALGQKDRVPARRVELVQPLLAYGRHIGKDRRPVLAEHPERLHGLAFDLRQGGGGGWAHVLDPAGDQILGAGGPAAIGNVRHVHPDRRVEQRAGEMGGGAHSGRTKLHVRLVRLR